MRFFTLLFFFEIITVWSKINQI